MTFNFTSAAESINPSTLRFSRVLFAACPTGAYCREDRCQSFFGFELIPTMRPPLEECEAAGALTALGASHRIIDAPAQKLSPELFIKSITEYNPDLIVLAVTFGSLEDDLKWAGIIKTHSPRALIGIRGAPCYVRDKELLERENSVDFCVRGDYELVFAAIASEGLKEAAGVTYRSVTGIVANPAPHSENLDELPLPDRSSIHQKLYSVRGTSNPQATIRVQRGCPFPCSYCLVHTVSGNKARHRSPRSIAAEMRKIIDSGTSHFYLRAETFSLNRNWAISVCNEIAKVCPEAKWVTTTRVECIDEDVASAMKSAGCYGISFGVDIASEQIGKLVKKQPMLNKAEAAMRVCDKFGILSLAYFMIGFVWENQSTLQETARFIRKISPDLLTIHFAHPYPGTEYFDIVSKLGKQTISRHAQAEPAISDGTISAAELRKFSRVLLVKHYTRPKVVASIFIKLCKNWFMSIRRKLPREIYSKAISESFND